jgi:heparan-alpha-glucosaminide N-acetyltransferase
LDDLVMTTAIPTSQNSPASVETRAPGQDARTPRITSIDAGRGFVMLVMIFVNDIAGVSDKIVPWWMKHYSDMQPRPAVDNGMTFVDLVFPAFLFFVGMSIPFALGNRLKKGERWHTVLSHVLIRTASLLLLGIMMVNAEGGPSNRPYLSRDAWTALMFAAAILGFSQLMPFWLKKDDAAGQRRWRMISVVIRAIGLVGLFALALLYAKTSKHHGVQVTSHILTLYPFSIRTSWYGILGLIGWAYLMGAIVYLIFGNKCLPLAVCTALLLGFWVAEHNGSFDNFYLPGFLTPVGAVLASIVTTINERVNLGEDLGSLAAITTAGVLLATILVTPETASAWPRIKFTFWFIAGAAFAAMLFYKPFLIWKNDATPPWCLWAMSVTAALWLLLYIVGDVLRLKWLTKPLAIAGQNVLLAYLFSEAMESVLNLARLDDWYDRLAGSTLETAIARSLGVAIILLAITAVLNRLGFRLKL